MNDKEVLIWFNQLLGFTMASNPEARNEIAEMGKHINDLLEKDTKGPMKPVKS